MSTTKAALIASCRRQIRDVTPSAPLQAVFTDDEIADLAGEAIDRLFTFYPKEVEATVSMTASVYSYSLSATVISGKPFRITVLNSDGTISNDDFRESPGHGEMGGWVLHAGTLRFGSNLLSVKTGMQLRISGYGQWGMIDSNSASSATTDLDTSALIAVRKYVAWQSIARLSGDRVKQQQIQQNPETTDVGPIALLQYRNAARADYLAEETRLRRFRKMG